MKILLFKKRSIPCPTLAGVACLLILAGSPVLWWTTKGESFFCLTERKAADVLVVEGWIGTEGVRAAKLEFEQGRYRYIVTAGGPMINRWDAQPWNYATESSEILVRLGVPADQVIAAPALGTAAHRTYEAAAAVYQVLQKHNLHPAEVNVFTLGVHARRSRLVFAKALRPSTAVGVIAWAPPHYMEGSWYESSERTLDLLKETVGYFFELLLNSGRTSNSKVVNLRPNE